MFLFPAPAPQVTHVSTDFSDTASVMCALDMNAGDSVADDDDGEATNGLLPLCPPDASGAVRGVVGSKLMRAFHAVVVTRNPHLVIGQQRLALLTVSLVQAMRQTMVAKHRCV